MKLSMTFCAIVALAAVGVAQSSGAPLAKVKKAKVFGAAERLSFGGNNLSKMPYPTPVLQNVDSDAEAEIVFGDLMGDLFVANRGSNSSDLVWEKVVPIKAANGENLKLQNW